MLAPTRQVLPPRLWPLRRAPAGCARFVPPGPAAADALRVVQGVHCRHRRRCCRGRRSHAGRCLRLGRRDSGDDQGRVGQQHQGAAQARRAAGIDRDAEHRFFDHARGADAQHALGGIATLRDTHAHDAGRQFVVTRGDLGTGALGGQRFTLGQIHRHRQIERLAENDTGADRSEAERGSRAAAGQRSDRD